MLADIHLEYGYNPHNCHSDVLVNDSGLSVKDGILLIPRLGPPSDICVGTSSEPVYFDVIGKSNVLCPDSTVLVRMDSELYFGGSFSGV